MEFHVPCTCGKSKVINEGAAGVTLTCECGKPVDIPPLSELRKAAGMSAYEVTPEMILQERIRNGKLPRTGACPVCDQWCEQAMYVIIECERPMLTGTPPMLLSFIGSLLGGVLWGAVGAVIGSEATADRQVHGEHKKFTVPIAVCVPCRQRLQSESVLRLVLDAHPVYRAVLEQYPESRIYPA